MRYGHTLPEQGEFGLTEDSPNPGDIHVNKLITLIHLISFHSPIRLPQII
jgi:hypothetical protein